MIKYTLNNTFIQSLQQAIERNSAKDNFSAWLSELLGHSPKEKIVEEVAAIKAILVSFNMPFMHPERKKNIQDMLGKLQDFQVKNRLETEEVDFAVIGDFLLTPEGLHIVTGRRTQHTVYNLSAAAEVCASSFKSHTPERSHLTFAKFSLSWFMTDKTFDLDSENDTDLQLSKSNNGYYTCNDENKEKILRQYLKDYKDNFQLSYLISALLSQCNQNNKDKIIRLLKILATDENTKYLLQHSFVRENDFITMKKIVSSSENEWVVERFIPFDNSESQFSLFQEYVKAGQFDLLAHLCSGLRDDDSKMQLLLKVIFSSGLQDIKSLISGIRDNKILEKIYLHPNFLSMLATSISRKKIQLSEGSIIIVLEEIKQNYSKSKQDGIDDIIRKLKPKERPKKVEQKENENEREELANHLKSLLNEHRVDLTQTTISAIETLNYSEETARTLKTKINIVTNEIAKNKKDSKRIQQLSQNIDIILGNLSQVIDALDEGGESKAAYEKELGQIKPQADKVDNYTHCVAALSSLQKAATETLGQLKDRLEHKQFLIVQIGELANQAEYNEKELQKMSCDELIVIHKALVTPKEEVAPVQQLQKKEPRKKKQSHCRSKNKNKKNVSESVEEESILEENMKESVSDTFSEPLIETSVNDESHEKRSPEVDCSENSLKELNIPPQESNEKKEETKELSRGGYKRRKKIERNIQRQTELNSMKLKVPDFYVKIFNLLEPLGNPSLRGSSLYRLINEANHWESKEVLPPVSDFDFIASWSDDSLICKQFMQSNFYNTPYVPALHQGLHRWLESNGLSGIELDVFRIEPNKVTLDDFTISAISMDRTGQISVKYDSAVSDLKKLRLVPAPGQTKENFINDPKLIIRTLKYIWKGFNPKGELPAWISAMDLKSVLAKSQNRSYFEHNLCKILTQYEENGKLAYCIECLNTHAPNLKKQFSFMENEKTVTSWLQQMRLTKMPKVSQTRYSFITSLDNNTSNVPTLPTHNMEQK